MLASQRGDVADASRVLDDALSQLVALSATEPADSKVALRLAKAWRLEAQFQYSAGRGDGAASAKQAIAIGEALLKENGLANGDVGDLAAAYVVAGQIAAMSGESAESSRDWQRADELLAPKIRGSGDWRLLDPSARAAAFLGRTSEARATIEKLKQFGYVPLDPWPALDRSDAARNPDPQPK
jgi:hypothetical protein